jgi:DNA-binding NtrC family response regulator
VDLAPLRARRQDVPALAAHLARQVARELDWPEPDGVRTAGTTLDRHAWPGNVRELRHLVTHAMVLRGRDARGPLDLTDALSALRDPALTRGRDGGFTLPPEGVSLEDIERGLVIQALARTGGNQTKAAALLSLHRDQMRYRIEKFGLKT